jgi:NAD(P)H-hydrate repair Nnr-like enzyme with NAD(P)H-hydrate epimerase domain
MAKEPKTNKTEAVADASDVTHLPLEYGDWKTDVHALGLPQGTPISKALAYVIANGFKQSMTDASAMTKEQKEKAHKEAQATHGEHITLEQAVEAKAHEARIKRFADILAGTVGFGGGGPKLPQVDRVMREIAEEQIKAAVVAKGLSMPKGDNLKALIDKRLSVAGDAIRTAAQARIDAAKNAVVDLGIDL